MVYAAGSSETSVHRHEDPNCPVSDVLTALGSCQLLETPSATVSCTFCGYFNCLKPEKIERTFLSHAIRFAKQHCIVEGSQASPVCPNGKSSM